MSKIVPTICRLCIAHCGVLAEVEDDNGRRKVTRVTGDPDNPMFKGYTCPKGRALPELHNHAGRLLHSMKRQPDGRHTPIDSAQAAIEVADRIKAIVDQYGPRAVAFYGQHGEFLPAGDRLADVLYLQHHRPARQADLGRAARQMVGR